MEYSGRPDASVNRPPASSRITSAAAMSQSWDCSEASARSRTPLATNATRYASDGILGSKTKEIPMARSIECTIGFGPAMRAPAKARRADTWIGAPFSIAPPPDVAA